MPWFEGSIFDAVATAKTRKAIFVVFVEGQDEASKKTFEALRSVEIGAKLQSDDFIVIKINSDGESFRQFAQIYHLVPVPSVFFIGNNGIPLEVVAGETQPPDLLRRINDVLTRSGKDPSQASSELLIVSEASGGGSAGVATEASAAAPPPQQVMAANITAPSNPAYEDLPEPTVPVAAQTPVIAASTSVAGAVSPGATATPTSPAGEEGEAGKLAEELGEDSMAAGASIEERVERAREIIEAKKLQKQEDEDREARNRELERRRVGQEVQKMKRWQQDREAAEAAAQIRKDRQAEVEARQRVLQQIAQDKAERAARQAKQEPRPHEEVVQRAVGARQVVDEARVQFRLPDGSTHTHVFCSNTPLSDVRSYASSHLQLPFRDFAMSMAFPRREFSAEDNARTVAELELCPTAVILILPAHRGEVVSQSNAGTVAVQWIWTLLAPLLSIYTYLRGFLWTSRGQAASTSRPGSPVPTATGHSTGAIPRTTANNASAAAAAQRRNMMGGTGATIRRQGNIHRLSNRQDSSDDDNNTWNGNSTQQM